MAWEMLFEEFQDGHPAPILDLEWNDFSHSESLCRSDAFHQVSALSDTIYKEMSFEEFQDGCLKAAILDIGTEQLLILNLYVAPIPPIKFQLNLP